MNKIDVTQKFVYVGFWKRVWATLIDVVVFLPLMPVTLFLMDWTFKNRNILPAAIYGIVWYFLYCFLIVRFGGTPGKLIIKARIVDGNGRYLSWRGTLLRNILPIFMNLNSIAQQYTAISHSPKMSSIGFLEIGEILNQYGGIYTKLSFALCFFLYADVAVLLFNPKKRALHDFIAGSYVVTNKSRMEMLDKSQTN